MIGIAWRQLRGPVVGTAGLTGLLVAVLMVHGAMARGVSAKMLAVCATADSESCGLLQDQLNRMFGDIGRYLGYLTITGVLVAAVWGAPMISREIESGTAALAWLQSVTRRRWFAVRLSVAVLTLLVLGSALGFAVTWWVSSFKPTSAGDPNTRGVVWNYGAVLPASWIAGMVVGVLVGTVIRRTLLAAAVTAVLTLVGTIAVGVVSGVPAGPTSSDILAFQVERGLVLLAFAAVVAVLCFRQVARVRV